MSYMLQFPPSALPKDVLSPPYALFGINDIDTFSDLPTNIPLNLVLHFAPTLRKWILPQPELNAAAIQMSLRTPFVGINIIADIEVEGLGWILARMMQDANMKLPIGNYSSFMFSPNLLISIAIHKAWLALELPPKGIDLLHVHIQTKLMIGPPVMLFEIKGLWHTFPVGSTVLDEMGANFIRNYIAKNYPPHESSAVRHWYLETTERWNFFRALEKQFPAFDNVQKDMMRAATERFKKEELHLQRVSKAEQELRAALEKNRASQDRNNDKEMVERKRRASKRRMERANSTESLTSVSSTSSTETIIFNPVTWKPTFPCPDQDPTTPTSAMTPCPYSQPVDSYALIEMLEEMAIEKRVRQEDMEAKKKAEAKTAAPGTSTPFPGETVVRDFA